MNVPNIITVARLILVPVIIYLIYLPIPWAKWAALTLFLVGMMSDIIDGVIARKRKIVTNFGIFLDPIVDKILVLSLFFVLSSMRVFSFWVPLIILWRELLVTGIRSVASSHGKVIGANWMGKMKAVLQTVTVVAGLLLVSVRAEGWLTDQHLAIGKAVVVSLGLLTVALSVVFAFIFTYWNRSLLLKNL